MAVRLFCAQSPLERNPPMRRPAHCPEIRFSQNFLHSPRLVERLVAIAAIGPHDTVLEIGPGKGIITAALAKSGCRVVAIEKDPRLAAQLRTRYTTNPRVQIHCADALHSPLPRGPYKVVASIPFAHTTEIVTRLTSAANAPDDSYLVLQREAAARFIGHPRGTLFAALLQPWFDLTLIHRFQRTDFAPPPAVEAVLLRMRKRGPPLLDDASAGLYRDLVIYMFTAWQPTVRRASEKLIGTRATRFIERDANIALDIPPSDLPPGHWAALCMSIHRARPDIHAQLLGAETRMRDRQRSLAKCRRTRARPEQWNTG
jgi:23S rRNA (adenine-N6)-dimethyltransferase